jgi:AbrB family looped-hinge helix DNA binding protein
MVFLGMRSTIDKAGRLVIPKALRDELGLRTAEVELTADGAALWVVPLHVDTLVQADGLLLILRRVSASTTSWCKRCVKPTAASRATPKADAPFETVSVHASLE